MKEAWDSLPGLSFSGQLLIPLSLYPISRFLVMVLPVLLEDVVVKVADERGQILRNQCADNDE